jgi:hypothetical protein
MGCMFICRERGSTLEKSHVENPRKSQLFQIIRIFPDRRARGRPLRTQEGGTSDQGRSSTDMKRGIRDVIQTVYNCMKVPPMTGKQAGIPDGCSGLSASVAWPRKKRQRTMEKIAFITGYLSHHAQTEPRSIVY